MVKDTKEFYEGYWEARQEAQRLHTLDGMWIPARIKIAVSMIVPEQKRSVSLLDIGCGEGTLGKVLRQQLEGESYLVGADISGTALRHASRYYEKVVEANIEIDDLAEVLPENRFDYVVCLEVLEHLFEPSNVLKQVRRLLKQNGFLIASFPNIAFWKYRLDLLKGKFPGDYTLSCPSEHIQNFTLHSFAQLLEETGFQPVAIDGDYVGPRFLRPRRLFMSIFEKFPNMFGCQLVIKARLQRRCRPNPR